MRILSFNINLSIFQFKCQFLKYNYCTRYNSTKKVATSVEFSSLLFLNIVSVQKYINIMFYQDRIKMNIVLVSMFKVKNKSE